MQTVGFLIPKVLINLRVFLIEHTSIAFLTIRFWGKLKPQTVGAKAFKTKTKSVAQTTKVGS